MFKKILVALDGSKLSREAVEIALDFIAKYGSQVKVVYVIDQRVFYQPHDIIVTPDNPYFKIFEELQKAATGILEGARKLAEEKGVSIETQILEGVVVDEILNALSRYRADCLFLGAHGAAGKKRGILGSTAQALALQAPCSTFIVRSK